MQIKFCVVAIDHYFVEEYLVAVTWGSCLSCLLPAITFDEDEWIKQYQLRLVLQIIPWKMANQRLLRLRGLLKVSVSEFFNRSMTLLGAGCHQARLIKPSLCFFFAYWLWWRRSICSFLIWDGRRRSRVF